jgi:hypothetical protein
VKNIAAQLIGGYITYKEAVGPLDLERWYSVTARFLADTTLTTLVHQLQLLSPLDAYIVKTKTCQYELLELSCAPEQLKSVVSMIIRTARLHFEVKECKLLCFERYEFINNTY